MILTIILVILFFIIGIFIGFFIGFISGYELGYGYYIQDNENNYDEITRKIYNRNKNDTR